MTAAIATSPRFKFFDNAGNPAVDYLLYTYEAGSTTPATTWQDKAQGTANTNPIQLDANGECLLWVLPTQEYKLVLKTPLGADVRTTDYVASVGDWLRARLASATDDNGAEMIGFIAPDASQRTVADLANSALGADLVATKQAWTGSADRTVGAKLEETKTPLDAGAAGDGTTDDTADVQAAWNTLAPTVTPATGYEVTSISSPAGTNAQGRGRASTLVVDGSGGFPVAGSNVVLDGLYLNGPGSSQLVYASDSASNVTLRDSELFSDGTASPNGHGVQINQASCDNWAVIDSVFDVNDFGVLTNTTAGGSKGLRVIGNHITTQKGDPVEINSPSTAHEDVAVVGNITKVVAGSGTSEGFSVGLAHVNGASVVGNISQRSWLAGDHIEDGSKNVTIVGNIRKKCLTNGFEHLTGGAGSNQAQTKPVTVIGNHYEADAIIAGYGGIRVVEDGNGTPYGDSIIGNVVRNFETGLWLGGLSTHHADGNVIDSCTYAMRVEEGNTAYTRVRGQNTVIGTATALLYVSSTTGAMVQAGKFVCDTKPTALISKSAPGTTRPGCSIEGFSWPQTQTQTAGVNTYAVICPAASTNRFRGRITLQAKNNAGISDNTWYSADIFFDGTTLTISNPISEYNGGLAMTSPALRINAGNLEAGFFHASAVTIRIDVDFDGIYMA